MPPIKPAVLGLAAAKFIAALPAVAAAEATVAALAAAALANLFTPALNPAGPKSKALQRQQQYKEEPS